MQRHLDLFSGIGGFALGLRMAGGFETVSFVEREPFCQTAIAKHWPRIPIHDDIRTFQGDECGAVDIITGGFPCQPWSVAGKRRGADDDRDLWPEMRRIIAAARPRWIIGENVPGVVQPAMGLRRVLVDLDALGYRSVTLRVPAAGVNAPHKRDRVWIVANRERQGLEGRAGSETRHERAPTERSGQAGGDVGNADGTWPVQPQGGERGQRGRVGDSSGIGPTPWDDADWIDCPDGKARRIKPGLCLLAHGVPGRVARLTALGNAVVPQIVKRLGLAINEAEKCSSSSSSASSGPWQSMKRRSDMQYHDKALVFFCVGMNTTYTTSLPHGVVLDGSSCQVLAVLDTGSEAGFKELWEYTADSQAFFEELLLGGNPDGPGIWVLETNYHEASINEDWSHLICNSTMRRLAPDEARIMGKGKPPFGEWA